MTKRTRAVSQWTATRWAEAQTCGGPGPKAVLMTLAHFAGYDEQRDEWSCFPGQETLADITEQSSRTVRRQLAKFDADGLISRSKRFDVHGNRTTDLYVLHVTTGQDDRRSDDAPTTGQPEQPPPDTAVSDELPGELPVELPDTDTRGDELEPVEPVDPIDEAFALWWQHYPNKQGKPLARRSFGTAMKTTGGDVTPLAEGLARWCTYWRLRDEPEYIPHPSTWLRREAWNDMPPPITKKASRFDALAVLDDDDDDDPPAGVVDVGSWPT